MMLADLQQHLKDTKRYAGAIDGLDGRLTEGGILLAMTDGPDTPLVAADFAESGKRLGVQPAAIRAFWSVEAAGAGFQDGRPKILPEPHRFSKNTKHAFDVLAPTLSYPKWGTRPYPAGQDQRYEMILAWVRLLATNKMPIDAAFASASYGAPQIMGENYAMCGYPDTFSFAEAMARDEPTQLKAFESFVDAAGILPFLRKVDRTEASFDPVAERYNGTAFRQNRYSAKMVAAFINFGGK